MADSLIRRLLIRLRILSADSPELAFRRFQRIESELRIVFLERASRTGKPRGLRWVGCDWLGIERLLCEKSSGQLTLLAGINIRFEAVEGGDMEDVEAVSMVRDGCAVFHYHKGRWGTGGRVLFNMHPDAAVLRLADSYSPVPDSSFKAAARL